MVMIKNANIVEFSEMTFEFVGRKWHAQEWLNFDNNADLTCKCLNKLINCDYIVNIFFLFSQYVFIQIRRIMNAIIVVEPVFNLKIA
jgi:hypothetical protein